MFVYVHIFSLRQKINSVQYKSTIIIIILDVGLTETLHIIIDLHIGYHRTGVELPFKLCDGRRLCA